MVTHLEQICLEQEGTNGVLTPFTQNSSLFSSMQIIKRGFIGKLNTVDTNRYMVGLFFEALPEISSSSCFLSTMKLF